MTASEASDQKPYLYDLVTEGTGREEKTVVRRYGNYLEHFIHLDAENDQFSVDADAWRAGVMLLLMREGSAEQDAYDAAEALPRREAVARFAGVFPSVEEEVVEFDPDEPTTDEGKDDSPSE